MFKNFVVVVMSCLLSVLCYPVGVGVWLLGFPIPYCVFEQSHDSASYLPFTSIVSPLLMLADGVMNYYSIRFILRRIRKAY